MSFYAPVPADTEPDAVDELIADAQQVTLPSRPVLDLASLPRQRGPIRVPDASLSLLEGYADYGS